MTSEIVLKALLSVVSIVASLVGIYVIPALKASKHHKEFAMLNDFMVDMVRSANQIYTPQEWKEKKGYVLKLVTDYVNGKTSLGFTEDQIDALIEGIVREVKVYDGTKGTDNSGNIAG